MLISYFQVDWEGVAQTMGYKNGRVASDRFRQVKKKLGWGAGVRVRVNKGTTPSKSNVVRARAPAKPRAPAAKKTAAKKAAPATKKGSAAKKLPKYVEKDDDEGSSEVEDEKPRDLMALSNDENDQEEKPRDLMAPSDYYEDDQEMSMQDKVARHDFNDSQSNDGELSAGAVDMDNRRMAEKMIQNQIAQEAGGEPVYEEYDAYDPVEVFEHA